MSNIQIKDGSGSIKYMRMNGAGTDLDPYVPVQKVQIADQKTALFNHKFRTQLAESTLVDPIVIGDKTCTVTSPTGFLVGHTINVYNVAGLRTYEGTVNDLTGSVLTVDTPFDFAYQAGDTIASGDHDLRSNGTSTPVVYSVRGALPLAMAVEIDITRLIITMETVTAPDWDDMGDITAGAVTEGVVLRKKTLTGYINILNFKSNADLSTMCYDMDILTGLGANGIKARITFGGMSKFGVVIALDPGEDLELVVQDDLRTITHFHVYAQGHDSDS